MKKILLLSGMIIASLNIMAQPSLTYKNNALVQGDVNTYREIQYVEPGTAGSNQIWDFSKIQFNGKTPLSTIQSAPSKELAGVGEYNLILNDGGYEFFMNFSEQGFEEKGYVNEEKDITLVFSDPIIKMKYPLAFGEQYTDTYEGIAYFQKTTRIDVTGDYTVTADAFGTLIFPDRVIKNALRVKISKNGLDRNMCGSIESNSVKYLWYAQGMRYPVLSISSLSYQAGGQIPTVTNTAFVNLDQPYVPDVVASSEEPQNQVEKSDVSVILFPNPFSEKITYNYFLRKQLPVSIDLFDMTGKSKVQLVKNQIQSEGLHTGELNGMVADLTPGVYYFRFTFDKQVIISKIVKI